MKNFTFYSPTEFVFGKETADNTGKLVKRYGGTKVLVVCGGSSARRSGLLDKVCDSLTGEGISYVIQEGIQPNPIAEKVYEGIEIARREKVDFLLAVGGGSVIDSAKGVALGAVYDGDFWDFYSAKSTPEKALPVGVVLTIPAAGSEGSGNSVITKFDDKGRHKISVRYPMVLRPKFAIMDPMLTMSLPWFQTACGIADMLSHIFERYFSNTPDCEVTDALAEALMRTIMAEALKLKENPSSYEARANIMWASTLAHNGLCGNGKEEDWASHRLEHEVSAFHDVAHGAGLAVITPAWMQFTARTNPGQVVKFATNVLGISPEAKTDDELCRLAVETLKGFYHTIGLTTSLRELIGKEPDIPTLVESLRGNMGDTLGFYVPLSMDDCTEIYRLSL